MIKKLYYIIMVVILSICFAGIYLVTTQGGLNLSLALATKMTNGALHVDKAKGSLIHHFEIDNLTYKSKNHNIAIKRTEVTWWPLVLLTGRLYIRKATLQDAVIQTTSTKTTTKESKKPFSLKLPLAISAHYINLKNIKFSQNDNQYNLQSANIDFYTWKNSVYIKQAELNLKPHHVSLKGSLKLVYPFNTNIQSQIISELKPYKPIQTNLSIKGNIKTAYHFSLTTKQPFTINLTGDIDHPLAKGKVNIHGQWENVLFPLSSDKKFTSRAGTLSITGPLNHYNISLNSDFSGTDIPKGDLSINGTGSLDQLDIQKLNAHLLNGSINGHIKFTWRPIISLQSNLNLNIGTTHMQINGGINKTWNLNWALKSPNLADILKGSRGSLLSNGQITGDRNAPIIKSNFRLKNLVFSTNNIGSADGSIYSDLRFDGTLKQPQFNGSIKLINAKTTVNALGTTFNRINLEVSAHQSNRFNLNGSLYSGSHRLLLSGHTNFSEFKFPFQLNIKGSNILAYNKRGYKIFLSPHLNLDYKQPRMRLSGRLNIPKASITPKDYSSAVTLPSDVVIIKQKRSLSREPTLGFYLNLHLSFGKDVFIASSGLTAKLGGNLQIHTAPQQLTTAEGQLNILNGSYKAFGTKLKIYKGNLIYTGGPIDNPGLNFSVIKFMRNLIATAQTPTTTSDTRTTSAGFENIMVGINITGTLKQPKLTLFSDPSGMHKSDILSYLLFGVPSGQTSGNQAQLLIAAAESTGLGGNITNTIKQTFGLSEIGFESDTIIDSDSGESQRNTSFVLGKYLTPKLYASYSVGIIVPINIFSLRYFLSKRWLIQTDSSTLDNGTDIFYTLRTN